MPECMKRVQNFTVIFLTIWGASSQEMSASMTGINESIAVITRLVGQIAESMQSMNQSAENSGENSGAVMKQMEELFRLSELLNQTVASFKG